MIADFPQLHQNVNDTHEVTGGQCLPGPEQLNNAIYKQFLQIRWIDLMKG